MEVDCKMKNLMMNIDVVASWSNISELSGKLGHFEQLQPGFCDAPYRKIEDTIGSLFAILKPIRKRDGRGISS